MGTRYILPSGLTVVVEQAPHPVTAIAATYRVGFRDEDVDTAGLTHLIEHLMGRAANAIASRDGVARWVVAESRRDYSTMAVTVSGDGAVPAIAGSIVRMSDVNVSHADLDVETALIEREYLDLIEARPYGLFPRFLAGLHLFDGVGEDGTGYGDMAMLRRQTPESVAAFLARHYTPARMVVTVVGDVDPDEVISAIAAHVGGRREVAPSRRKPHAHSQLPADRYATYQRDGVPAAVALAWRLPDPAGAFRDHVNLVLCGQAAFATGGPVARWLQRTHPGLSVRACWAPYNSAWDVRTGLSLVVELGGAGIDALIAAAAELRRTLPGLVAGLPVADRGHAAESVRLALSRILDDPMNRARLLGSMEALFDGAVPFADLGRHYHGGPWSTPLRSSEPSTGPTAP